MKSREDVEQLKKSWKCDPLWDIECTEGFEEYYDELLAFRNEIEADYYIELKKYREYQLEEMIASLK